MEPLVLKPLKNVNILQNSKDYLTVRATTGPSKSTKIPKFWSNELALVLGILLGDGHLKKDKKRITLELTNRRLLEKVARIIKELFNIEVRINSRAPQKVHWKELHYFYVDNSAIFQLFEQLGIPKGNKSKILRVPNIMLHTTNTSIKRSFVIGIFLAEGGRKKRRNCYGMSSASQEFLKEVSELLTQLNIESKFTQWFNKKYKREYFAIYFKTSSLETLTAGVPEWSNGLIRGSET